VSVTLLTEDELRSCVGLADGELNAVERGFARLAAGDVVQPPIMRIDVEEHNGEVDVKGAYVPGWDHFAVKLSSGFFDNAKLGLPSASGMMLLLNSRTGVPAAVLLDNGYLTEVRTALAGAIAAKYLAPEAVDTVAVFGAGGQARAQVAALELVRDFERVLVWNRNVERAQRYVQETQEVLGVEVTLAADPAEAVAAAQLVVTTTPAKEPIFRAKWLHPGLHVTAMGSDAEVKNEIEPEVFGKVDRIVCDSIAQCLRLGELHHAREAWVVDESTPMTELGEIVSGEAPRRQSEDEITICDLTGTGVQDTAIANFALHAAAEAGLGTQFG
jgi:ornithine cyclodeaminase